MVFILLTFYSCNTIHDVSGIYATKFADLGFFSTTIKLNKDSTFQYRWVGDLLSDNGIGTYSVEKRKITLKFIPSKHDTISYYEEIEDSIPSFQRIGDKYYFKEKKLIKKTIHVLEIKNRDNRKTLQCYFRNNKLLGLSKYGKVINMKSFVYSRRKKYFLFGSHYFKRKNPLIKINIIKESLFD